MGRDSFVLYTDTGQNIELLPDEEAGRLIKALFRYVGKNELPQNLSPAGAMAFGFIRSQLDRDGAKYEATCRKRADAGRRGGLQRAENAKKSQANQANATLLQASQANQADNESDSVPDTDPDTESESDNDRADRPPPSPSFTPPTVQEVENYCRERNNGIDAERFVDHYSACGWMLGRSPMTDWRAGVRCWEKTERGSKMEQSRKTRDASYPAPQEGNPFAEYGDNFGTKKGGTPDE